MKVLTILLMAMVLISFASAQDFSPSDVNQDGDVDDGDLNKVKSHWGECPPKEDCIGDVNSDNTVNVNDLLQVLGDWTGDAFVGSPKADINSDGTVNVNDLLSVLGAWGECENCPQDINQDGVVDDEDLETVLNSWGDVPEEENESSSEESRETSSSGGGDSYERQLEKRRIYYMTVKCNQDLWTEIRPTIIEKDYRNILRILYKEEYDICRLNMWGVIKEILLRQ